MATQRSIGASPCKAPIDAASSGVAPLLPGRDLCGEYGLLGRAACQALALQNANLDLGHVEPSRMLWRVVKLDLTQQRRCHLYTEYFVKALSHVRIEVVQNQVDFAYVGIPAAQHPANESDEVDLGAPRGDLCESALAARSTATKMLHVPARSYS
jgi:hypothetical protein